MVAGRTCYVAWSHALTQKVLSLGLPPCAQDLTPAQLAQVAEVQIECDLTVRDEGWRKNNEYAAVGPWPGDWVQEEDVDWF